MNWISACNSDDLAEEDLVDFIHAGRVYAIYRTPSGVYATDGICTHQTARLSRGCVIGEHIECPLHQGRFHIPSGAAKSAPASVALRTYPTKVEDGRIFIGLPE